MQQLLPLLLAVSFIAHAEDIYKWTDDRGRIHYGSKQPQAAPAERLEIESAPSADEQETLEPGLRPGEQQMLEQIERRNARERLERARRARRLEQEKRRQAADERSDKALCERYQRRYDAVKDKLTSGYRAREANYLHAKEENYGEKVKRYCKKLLP